MVRRFPHEQTPTTPGLHARSTTHSGMTPLPFGEDLRAWAKDILNDFPLPDTRQKYNDHLEAKHGARIQRLQAKLDMAERRADDAERRALSSHNPDRDALIFDGVLIAILILLSLYVIFGVVREEAAMLGW